jgi:hypothetical protein
MLTRRHGAPLLRGALTAGLAPQRGEDAATPSVAGWLGPQPVPSSPISVPPSPGLPVDERVAELVLRHDRRW